MNDVLQAALALWGAVLATVLGVFQVRKYIIDKPRIAVGASLAFRFTNKCESIRGTLIETEHGSEEVLLALQATNRGGRSLQIMACLVEETNGNLNQVTPAGLPAVLEPNTQINVDIQKEWIDDVAIARLGMLDALGRVHTIDSGSLACLMLQSKALPSNKQKHRNRSTGEIVTAFQVRDHAVLTKRVPEDRRPRWWRLARSHGDPKTWPLKAACHSPHLGSIAD